MRHHDGADCVGVPFGFLGAKPQSPGGDCGAHAIGEDLVPLKYVGEPLLEQDVQGLPQSIKHGQRRRIGKIACGVCFHLVAEVEECPRAARVFVGG
jgi:hypothetical protein